MVDVADLPPSAFALPTDKRKAAHLQRQRKALAVLLARSANADGSRIFPSVDTLKAKMECSRATIFRLLKDLETLGLIINGGYHGFYKTRMRLMDVSKLAPVSNTTPTPVADSPAPVSDSAAPVSDRRAPVSKLFETQPPSLPPSFTAKNTDTHTAIKPAPQNGAAATPKGVCLFVNQWAQFMANIPEPMQDAQFFKTKPEVEEKLGQLGVYALVGICRAWYPRACDADDLFKTRATKWQAFLDALPAYIPKAEEYAKNERQRQWEQSPEGIAAKAAAEEKLRLQYVAEQGVSDEFLAEQVALEAEWESPDFNPLAGVE
jgi:hypothetical protein